MPHIARSTIKSYTLYGFATIHTEYPCKISATWRMTWLWFFLCLLLIRKKRCSKLGGFMVMCKSHTPIFIFKRKIDTTVKEKKKALKARPKVIYFFLLQVNRLIWGTTVDHILSRRFQSLCFFIFGVINEWIFF